MNKHKKNIVIICLVIFSIGLIFGLILLFTPFINNIKNQKGIKDPSDNGIVWIRKYLQNDLNNLLDLNFYVQFYNESWLYNNEENKELKPLLKYYDLNWTLILDILKENIIKIETVNMNEYDIVVSINKHEYNPYKLSFGIKWYYINKKFKNILNNSKYYDTLIINYL